MGELHLARSGRLARQRTVIILPGGPMVLFHMSQRNGVVTLFSIPFPYLSILLSIPIPAHSFHSIPSIILPEASP